MVVVIFFGDNFLDNLVFGVKQVFAQKSILHVSITKIRKEILFCELSNIILAAIEALGHGLTN